jgi:hypothetical protein
VRRRGTDHGARRLASAAWTSTDAWPEGR